MILRALGVVTEMATVSEKSTLPAVKLLTTVMLVTGCSVEGGLLPIMFIDYYTDIWQFILNVTVS